MKEFMESDLCRWEAGELRVHSKQGLAKKIWKEKIEETKLRDFWPMERTGWRTSMPPALLHAQTGSQWWLQASGAALSHASLAKDKQDLQPPITHQPLLLQPELQRRLSAVLSPCLLPEHHQHWLGRQRGELRGNGKTAKTDGPGRTCTFPSSADAFLAHDREVLR